MSAKIRNSIKVTIIVTIHNAEKYLNECLNSAISQTFQDIEILCMDGGSTDDSPNILKEYALKDNRIRIINDTDTSYGHKVNEGIRQAKGTYISVLESDDIYCFDMIERLYAVAEKEHVDYVNADYLEFRDVDEKRYCSLVKMYRKDDYGKVIESKKHPESMTQILRYWTGIFRRDFLIDNEIWMNESPGASFQDMSFRFLTSALADTCYHLDFPVYLYRADNPGSSVYDPRKVAVIADEFKFLERELYKRRIEDTNIIRQYYIWKYNDFYGNLVRFDNVARKKLFEQCYIELKKDRGMLLRLQEFDLSNCSKAIHKLLNKKKEDVWLDIEQDYQENKQIEIALWNLLKEVKGRKLVIFGCGQKGKGLLMTLHSVYDQIMCYTDNSEILWGTDFYGFPVLSPQESTQEYSDAFYVVANKYHTWEIVRQLLELGIQESNIFLFC